MECNSGRATREHKGRGTVTHLPPLILFPCTEALWHSRVISECCSLASCLPSTVCLLLAPPPPCKEWFDLLRLQWHTRGRWDLVYRV